MGSRAPPTLLQLALERLLREEALVISALEDLPVGMFPEMFKKAFNDRLSNILRAMVPAWPFPCLPAGGLIYNPHLETLKGLLDGLDVLITEKVHPRSKLRVLDLINVNLDFWSLNAGSHKSGCSPQSMRQPQSVEMCPNSVQKKPFTVVTELEITKASFTECDIYLLQWAKRQKASVHLCCRKLHIWDAPVFTATQLFNMVDVGCIQELRLSQWCLQYMAHIFPYLGQMRHLRTLILEIIRQLFTSDAAAEPEWISLLLSQFSKLPCLQNLCVNDVYFLTGCLEEWLRCLNNPLVTLSITYCRLSQSDLRYLSQCLVICELKHLNLSGVELSNSCPKLLGVLLERLKSTLQTLELEQCNLKDPHFNAILPALTQCSQLTKINFYRNDISLLVLKNLLHHTAKMRRLTQELYPAPLECYDYFTILRDKFIQLCPELLDILKVERQPRKVSFATRACFVCFKSCFYDHKARLCLCSYAG